MRAVQVVQSVQYRLGLGQLVPYPHSGVIMAWGQGWYGWCGQSSMDGTVSAVRMVRSVQYRWCDQYMLHCLQGQLSRRSSLLQLDAAA